MASTADASMDAVATRVRLLDDLRERLEAADEETRAVREALVLGDERRIDAATSRLRTLALEYRLLADEYRRAAGQHPAPADHPRIFEAFSRLEETATRIARTSAVVGGGLERMVAMSRGLLEVLPFVDGSTYLPSGRRTEHRAQGVRLKEQA